MAVVPGNFRLTPDDDEWPMVFPAGTFKGLLLWADTSFKDEANGVAAESPQHLRIAVLDATGAVLEKFDEHVGRDPAAAKPWARLDLHFKNAAKTAEINITRLDAGTKRIGFCLYS
jgi:hypothetical protein